MLRSTTTNTSRILRVHLSLARARCHSSNSLLIRPQFIAARFLPRIARAHGTTSDDARTQERLSPVHGKGVAEDTSLSFRRELIRDDPSLGSKRFAEEAEPPQVMRQVLVCPFYIAMYWLTVLCNAVCDRWYARCFQRRGVLDRKGHSVLDEKTSVNEVVASGCGEQRGHAKGESIPISESTSIVFTYSDVDIHKLTY